MKQIKIDDSVGMYSFVYSKVTYFLSYCHNCKSIAVAPDMCSLELDNIIKCCRNPNYDNCATKKIGNFLDKLPIIRNKGYLR